ncbi:Scn11a [Symbiodinium natans]|uniref:Scn11a protein n=1 Tax=Symbiodinium natans TaxID=878477 RepID=A0A812LUG5_9DINO|nr:Scn11a [Symbiodinium natans]
MSESCTSSSSSEASFGDLSFGDSSDSLAEESEVSAPGRFGSWFRCTSLDKRPTRSSRGFPQQGDGPALTWRAALPDCAWAIFQLLLLLPVLVPEFTTLSGGANVCADVIQARRKHLGGAAHGIQRAMRFSVLVYASSALINIAANLFISLRMRKTFASASGQSKMLSTEASVCTVLSLSWLLAMLSAGSCAATWCLPGIRGFQLGFVLNVATTPVLLLLVAAFIRSVKLRLQLLEVGYGNPLGAQWLKCWVHTLVVMAMLATAWHVSSYVASGIFHQEFQALISKRDLGAQGTRSHDKFVASLVFISFSITSTVTVQAFQRMEQAAQPAVVSRDLGAYIKAEAAWAKTELRNARLAVLLTCLSSAVAALLCIFRPWILEMCSRDDDRCFIAYQLVVPVLELGAVSVEIISLFALLGIFSDKPPDIRVEARQTRRFSQGSRRMHRLDSDTEAWWATARELASRSISLQQLLRFWASLGSNDSNAGGPMPHYDADYSTTNDVVRQAIIPMSRVDDGGVSLAQVLQTNTGADLPHAMVTHSWRNNFRDLVAAIIADAGKKDQYWRVANKLNTSQSPEGLLRKLRGLEQRYWICAFCVNQHASICNGFTEAPPRQDISDFARWWASRHDSVTKEPLPVCSCCQPKLFSNKDPTRCELNKFDDMMTVLHDSVLGFRQVVAVDRQLDVFHRAWCVAELVEASRLDMQQVIQVHKTSELDIYSVDTQAYATLATLSVRDCSASRPEDKADILAKIGDTEEFDAKLHAVIFGQHGLLGRRFHGFGALDAAARTARRVKEVCELRRKDHPSSP